MIDFSVNNQCESTRFYWGVCHKSTKRRKQHKESIRWNEKKGCKLYKKEDLRRGKEKSKKMVSING